MSLDKIPGSFRDPSGFLFIHAGTVYRQINPAGAEDYDRLMSSGLYASLTGSGQLISHEEVDLPACHGAYRVIRPVQLPFISYPYEWSFGQLEAAALLTLEIQRQALAHGQMLRDASAYNIQFHEGRAVFIDTLSFGAYREGEPWVAYQQFCKHFLAPLALMAKVDVSLSQLLRTNIDGVPLDLACKLLPFSTKLSFPLLTHLHLHARSSRKWADAGASGEPITAPRSGGVSRNAMIGILDSLENGVRSLNWSPTGTEWADYYAGTNYTEASHAHKAEIVGRFVERSGAKVVWDLGGNTGVFSKIAADRGAAVYSFDVDPAAVERNWRKVVADGETRILPLLQDLTNPSPAIGWNLRERRSLLDRGSVDLVIALALIHHIALSNNVPLDDIARFLRELGRYLIIEFVPKEDSQVRRLLATREDIFPNYCLEGFERALAPYFEVIERVPIRESVRTLFLAERR
jgi:SAM-dependent methyltransferase